MKKQPSVIHPIRQAVPAPDSIIDVHGQAAFGTFSNEFKEFNFLEAKSTSFFPSFLNRFRFTAWQAIEVHFSEGILLSAVADMVIFGKMLNVFYEKTTGKVYSWDTTLSKKQTVIAENLLQGNRSSGQHKKGNIVFENHLEQGACAFWGDHKTSSDTLSYHFALQRISLPSIVSIPLSPNRPVYTQKDFCRAKGHITINGTTYHSDENTTAIIDDHRGYYPRKSHYDWVTTLGKYPLWEKEEFFALNITRNQSMDQNKYNENLFWLENSSHLLPPVRFEKSIPMKDFKTHAVWKIHDDHDHVNVLFHINSVYPMILNRLVVKTEYYIVFGHLEGYVKNAEGQRYPLEGMIGMGEDKSLLF